MNPTFFFFTGCPARAICPPPGPLAHPWRPPPKKARSSSSKVDLFPSYPSLSFSQTTSVLLFPLGAFLTLFPNGGEMRLETRLSLSKPPKPYSGALLTTAFPPAFSQPERTIETLLLMKECPHPTSDRKFSLPEFRAPRRDLYPMNIKVKLEVPPDPLPPVHLTSKSPRKVSPPPLIL